MGMRLKVSGFQRSGFSHVVKLELNLSIVDHGEGRQESEKSDSSGELEGEGHD